MKISIVLIYAAFLVALGYTAIDSLPTIPDRPQQTVGGATR